MQVLYNAVLEAVGQIKFKPPQNAYDAPPLPKNSEIDEPLSFAKLRQEVVTGKPKNDFESRLYAAECGEDLQLIGMEINRSALSRFEKQRLNVIGQKIYNEKFNF